MAVDSGPQPVHQLSFATHLSEKQVLLRLKLLQKRGGMVRFVRPYGWVITDTGITALSIEEMKNGSVR